MINIKQSIYKKTRLNQIRNVQHKKKKFQLYDQTYNIVILSYFIFEKLYK